METIDSFKYFVNDCSYTPLIRVFEFEKNVNKVVSCCIVCNLTSKLMAPF